MSPSDFDVPLEEAQEQYEKFLMTHGKFKFSGNAETAEYKFQVFWRNLQRIMFHNHIEQGTAIYGYVIIILNFKSGGIFCIEFFIFES